jgi:hypothetical protein
MYGRVDWINWTGERNGLALFVVGWTTAERGMTIGGLCIMIGIDRLELSFWLVSLGEPLFSLSLLLVLRFVVLYVLCLYHPYLLCYLGK